MPWLLVKACQDEGKQCLVMQQRHFLFAISHYLLTLTHLLSEIRPI